jgi:HEAT repeat protein
MNVKDYRAQVEAQLGSASAAGPAQTAAAGNPERAWQDAFATLANPVAAPSARREALQVLQSGTFLGHRFDPLRPRYTQALRDAATNSDQDLRHFALDTLVDLKDAFARQLLTDGLTGKIAALLPAPAALGLLARDDHVSASALAQDLLSKSVDAATRMQAARVLGADPKATDLLTNIMKNKDEFREVRSAGAAALKGLNPKLFQDSAIEILNDPHDFDDIKSTVRGALERAGVDLSSIGPDSK